MNFRRLLIERWQIAGLALEAKLPIVCEWAEMARDGCLIGYGPNRTELRKRMADQTAKIFRGATPRDIRSSSRLYLNSP